MSIPTPQRVAGISVIIPALNAEKYIRHSIQSVLDQTTKIPLEIVVVDDGSNDRTTGIAKSFEQPNIKLKRSQLPQGVSNARNYGISIACYDWIAFNDADDVWLPTKLEKQIRLLNKQPQLEGVVGGQGRLAKDNSQWVGNLYFKKWSPVHIPTLSKPPCYDPFHEDIAFIQTLLVSKKALMEAGLFRDKLDYFENWDLLLRIGNKFKLGCIEEAVFLYRICDSNSTAPGKADAKAFLASQDYCYAVRQALLDAKPEPSLQKFYRQNIPSSQALMTFKLNQSFRSINTKWVNKGLFFAFFELVKILLKNPVLSLRYISQRFRYAH